MVKIFWHGTPNDPDGSSISDGGFGIHVGTYVAARQALEARIGIPADGRGWDGTRVYGETLLAGKIRIKRLGTDISGYNCDMGEDDSLPPCPAHFGDGHKGQRSSEVPMDARPAIFPVRIVGPMTNSFYAPKEDFRANGMMRAQIKQGRAKSGYFYRNVGEDSGSISAVVPSARHLVRVNLALEPESVRRAAEQERLAAQTPIYANYTVVANNDAEMAKIQRQIDIFHFAVTSVETTSANRPPYTIEYGRWILMSSMASEKKYGVEHLSAVSVDFLSETEYATKHTAETKYDDTFHDFLHTAQQVTTLT